MKLKVIPILKYRLLKLTKVLVKRLRCCYLLSARCVYSSQNKDLLEMFPFLSFNCRKTGNTGTRIEIVNSRIGCVNLWH